MKRGQFGENRQREISIRFYVQPRGSVFLRPVFTCFVPYSSLSVIVLCITLS